MTAAAVADDPPPQPEPALVLSRLDSGVRVVTEEMPEARSVTVGFWVGIGGRDEPEALSGASHFLEHLLFKGSERRGAREIAEAVDAVGGEMNAYTSREHTAYYVRLPERHLDFGLELLAEVVSAPALRPPEVDSEREVILEELLMSEDSPEDRVHQALADALFPGHPLGREVLGSQETIEAMSRDDIAGFHTRHYRPANLVVAAAGRLDHDSVVDRLASFLDGVEAGAKPVRTAPEQPPVAVAVVTRPTEQAHVTLAWRTFGHDDPDRYALLVANQILGGGMASRLFQKVREERGLVYSVYSHMSLNSDVGALSIYAGTSPARMAELLTVLDAEVARMGEGGVSARELEVATGYLEGSFLLGLEESGSRMSRLGKSLITRGEIVPVDEFVARLRAVSAEDVARAVGRVLTGPRSLAALGPFDESAFN